MHAFELDKGWRLADGLIGHATTIVVSGWLCTGGCGASAHATDDESACVLSADTERALERSRGVSAGRESAPSLFARCHGGGVVVVLVPELARERGFHSFHAISNRRAFGPECDTEPPAASVDATSPSAPGVSHGVRHVGQCLECSNHCFAHLACMGCSHVVHRIDSLHTWSAQRAQISVCQG